MFNSAIEEIPQDKVDAIVNQLAGNNSSLAACSFVSKRWQARCRQQSFRRARTTDLEDLRSSYWYPGNLPVAHAPHQDTRDSELWLALPTLPHHHIHFKSFSQITSLTLDRFSATPFDPLALERDPCDLTSDPRSLQHFISAAGKNARRLRIVVPDHEVVPTVSIMNCEVLEELFVSVLGTATSLDHVPSLLASITSPCFRKFILELRTPTQRGNDAAQIALADCISQLDGPLSRLAQNAVGIDPRVSLVLLGQDPEFLAQGLFDFQESGYVWAGEDVGGGEYSWTLAAPRNNKARRCRISILDKLFSWKKS